MFNYSFSAVKYNKNKRPIQIPLNMNMDILMQWSMDNILKISAVKLIFEISTFGAVFKQRKIEGRTSGRTLKICSNNSVFFYFH